MDEDSIPNNIAPFIDLDGNKMNDIVNGTDFNLMV